MHCRRARARAAAACCRCAPAAAAAAGVVTLHQTRPPRMQVQHSINTLHFKFHQQHVSQHCPTRQPALPHTLPRACVSCNTTARNCHRQLLRPCAAPRSCNSCCPSPAAAAEHQPRITTACSSRAPPAASQSAAQPETSKANPILKNSPGIACGICKMRGLQRVAGGVLIYSQVVHASLGKL